MTDILTRLWARRTETPTDNGLWLNEPDKDCDDAAKEIERLTAQVEKMQKALKPFADHADLLLDGFEDVTDDVAIHAISVPHGEGHKITLGDLRAAKEASK
jgi:hypothetical protein